MNTNDFEPVGIWSGSLILPKENTVSKPHRILIELENTPLNRKEFIGKTVELDIAENSLYAEWQKAETFSIKPDSSVEAAIKKGDILPERLFNKGPLTSLETLAGTRQDRTMRVILNNPIDNLDSKIPCLLLTEEPIQTDGTHFTFVQFTSEENKETFPGFSNVKAKHYNSNTQDFSGTETNILFSEYVMRKDKIIPQTSFNHIYKSSLNEKGFYVYGYFDSNKYFHAEGLEPFELKALPERIELSSNEQATSFINTGLWENMSYGTFSHKTMANNNTNNFKLGDAGFVIHLFGWRGGEKGDKPDFRGFVTGHTAFGTFKVIECPLAKKPVFEVIYNQIYSHNPEGIVSGSMKRSNYLGSLQRGWMYTVPISDILIKSDAFNENSLSIIRNEFSRMQARTRSGSGTGRTPANMAVSCSQNSVLALLCALKKLKDPASIKEFKKEFSQIFLPRGFGSFRLVPKRWRKYMQKKNYTRLLPEEQWLYANAFLSMNSVLPREVHDRLALLFFKKNAVLHFNRLNQVGGFIQGIEPLWPTTFSIHYPIPEKTEEKK